MAENNYIIWGDRQGQPLVGLQRIWEKVRAQAGLEDVRMHDLRHTYASFGAAAWFGLFVIGHVLGHADAATTQRYAHLGPDPVRMAAERITEEVAAALLTRAVNREAPAVPAVLDLSEQRPERRFPR